MKISFLDSSALVKRYVTEVGSIWIQALTTPTVPQMIIVARITWVEVLSAFARLQREGKIDSAQMTKTRHIFQYDWETQYQQVEIDAQVIETAGQLVQKYPLRAYDSVQLAAALILYPFFLKIDPKIFTFVSADARLLNIAQAEGLVTENPNNYPEG